MESSLRVTTQETLDAFCQWLEPLCEKYIVAVEYGSKKENRHMQCYIKTKLTDDIKQNKLRYKIEKQFGKGNGVYSLTKMKSDALMSYCLKESKEIKYYGITDQEIEHYKSLSYEKPMSYSAKKKQLGKLYSSGQISKNELLTKFIKLLRENQVEYYEHKILAWVKTLDLQRSSEFEQITIALLLEKSGGELTFGTRESDFDDLESLASDDEILEN